MQSNPFYNAHHRKGGTTTPRKNTQLEICNRHAKHWNDDEKRYIFGAIKPWYMEEKKFWLTSKKSAEQKYIHVLKLFSDLWL